MWVASMMVPSPVPPPAISARSGCDVGPGGAEDPVVDLSEMGRAADDQPLHFLPRVPRRVGVGLVLRRQLRICVIGHPAALEQHQPDENREAMSG